ncbi:PRC-barrel domain-containing protein [Legionella lytica]|uniref:PRC-barrel domain-containing protein n=1 Tax=Legionella lytica TaxID=96232 RepID=A0ABW8D977_9GAMM
MENHNVVKASEITGVKVQNTAGEDIGDINEVVLDKISGQVNYLVLDFGGFLGFGNKFFAVPWNAFSYDKEDDCFILNVDKDRLKNAPGFDKEHWPNFADRNVTESITKYYQI